MKKIMMAALVAASGVAVVNAAVITQVGANGSGGGDDWNVTSLWSDGLAPASGNSYIISDRVNSPDTAATPQTFAGDSITLVDGANFQIRCRAGEADAVTVNNLIMNGGALRLNKGSTTYGLLKGSMSVIGTTTIAGFQNATQQRNLRIDSLITSTGTPSLNLRGSSGYSQAGDAYYQIGNAANTFGGTWDIASIRSIFTSAGATGVDSSFVVGDEGYLRINESWSGDMSVIDGAEVQVNSGVTYTLDLTANGSAVANGSYSVADLNTEIGSNIFSGDGSIEVVPEPAVLSLVAVFGGSILFGRRFFGA